MHSTSFLCGAFIFIFPCGEFNFIYALLVGGGGSRERGGEGGAVASH